MQIETIDKAELFDRTNDYNEGFLSDPNVYVVFNNYNVVKRYMPSDCDPEDCWRIKQMKKMIEKRNSEQRGIDTIIYWILYSPNVTLVRMKA